MTFEERIENSKQKLVDQMNANKEKIADLTAQRDAKIEEIKEKKKEEIFTVNQKCKEQVDALSAKNKELQGKWNDLEKKRSEKHGKDIGDLFNQFVDKNVDAEAVKILFEEKGAELAKLLNDLQGTGDEEEETEETEETVDTETEDNTSTEEYNGEYSGE